MKKLCFLLSLIILFSCSRENTKAEITPPKLTNNPSWDVICTNEKPLLSFFCSHGGFDRRTYVIQLDTDPNFNTKNFIEYKSIEEFDEFLVEKRIDKPLIDKIRYYWRAKAKDSKGNESPWTTSRFYVDTSSDKYFMNLSRISVKDVIVSSGENSKNIIDYDDPGQITFWSATPPGPIKNSVKFDFGEEKTVSRIWMLSNIDSDNGWLKDFSWEYSRDDKTWEPIPKAEIKNNDTFRNIIDISPVNARFLKLKIHDYLGVSPQLNCVIFYSPYVSKIPAVPEGKYVLLIGDQMNGFTFTQLANYIETLKMKLKTYLIPHYEISYDLLQKIKNKPIAIIFSGNNADYPNLPMFEYNGVFEIIRNSDIPILGICAGHQMLAFAYGYSFVRAMGWKDISALGKKEPINILIDNKIFKGIKNPFIAPEDHGWSIAVVSEDFEILAQSSYIQCIKHKSKNIYGCQFHPEIELPDNEGKNYLINFLKMALKKNK